MLFYFSVLYPREMAGTLAHNPEVTWKRLG
jgi:hypothetical protein